MTLSKVDKEIKVLLKERDNLPLNDKEITKIRRKTDLLKHLRAHSKNIARFEYRPITVNITYINKTDLNDYETYELKDIVKNVTFTGDWEKDRR